MYRYSRTFVGSIRACILDWSGTTVDKYAIAPVEAVCKLFENEKIPITKEEARGPMGIRKDLHIRAILQNENVNQRWLEQHVTKTITKSVLGSVPWPQKIVKPSEKNVEELFEKFVPLQEEVLKNYTKLIPGVIGSTHWMQHTMGIKIGLTTGFMNSMSEILLESAIKQGFVPDCVVSGDDVEHGSRPKPFMVYKNMEMLNAWPIESIVKVDDTAEGVSEGLAAGCWTVGVSRYSTYMNIDSLEHEESLSEEEMKERHEYSKNKLKQAGAHFVVDAVYDLPSVISIINDRMKHGACSYYLNI